MSPSAGRPHRFARALVIALASGACFAACSGFSGEDGEFGGGPSRSVQPDAAPIVDAGRDARATPLVDAGDAALAAGDPSLRREPRVGCTLLAADATVPAAYPDWTVFRYDGVASSGPLAPSYELFHCDDVWSLSLAYDDGIALRDQAPAFGFGRPSPLTGSFFLGYVVEAVAQPDEDEEAFLGGFALSVDRPAAGQYGLILSFVRRPGAGEIVLRKRRLLQDGGFDEEPSISLGAPVAPYRIGWAVTRGATPLELVSAITVTDGQSQRTVTSNDLVPLAEVTLQLGLNRINPNNRSRFTISNVVLP